MQRKSDILVKMVAGSCLFFDEMSFLLISLAKNYAQFVNNKRKPIFGLPFVLTALFPTTIGSSRYHGYTTRGSI